MSNLRENRQIDVNKLRTLQELRGKVIQLFSREQIMEFADKKLIPHYILTNPVTREEYILFSQDEVNSWLLGHVQQVNFKMEQELNFIYFEFEKYLVSPTDKIPAGLHAIKNLMR